LEIARIALVQPERFVGMVMADILKQLFGRRAAETQDDVLGEDMAPSPSALAEHTALSGKHDATPLEQSRTPFSSRAKTPIRDF